MSDAGGTPQPLTHLEKADVSHRWPEFLPGGKAVLFTAGGTTNTLTNSQVAVQSSGRANGGILSKGEPTRATRPRDTWFMRKAGR